MGKILGSLFGSAPKASRQPQVELEGEKRKAKKSRTALFATEGGASGEELNPEQVRSRSTLLGN